MKFKIASIWELIIPLSVALMLTAFLGCGGGGAYGNATQAYDGTWSLNLKGYPLPPLASSAPAGAAVSCTERDTTIVIDHGFGTTRQYEDCLNATFPVWFHDIHVTITPDATGTTGTVKAETFNGSILTGICIDRLACQATPGLTLIKL